MKDVHTRLAELEAAVRRLTPGEPDDGRLLAEVRRLADETGDLSTILAKVDAQQRSLTLLGHAIERVREEGVTTQELAVKEETAHRARKRLTVRVFAAIVLVAVLLNGVLVYTVNADYHACIDRETRFDLQVKLYNSVAKSATGPVASEIQKAATALENSSVNCSDTYPVHWGKP